MKRLSGWDTYVREATRKGDRSIELPLTPDETYVITYPTRRQGKAISKAQAEGDTDAMLIALIGEEAGTRVLELSEDEPSYVLDEFLIDVMKKFGMLIDDEDDGDSVTVNELVTEEEASVNGGKSSEFELDRDPQLSEPSEASSTASN